MAVSSDTFGVLRRLGIAFNSGNFPFCLKPLQVKCFDYILKGYDVVAVLPTGFGKSLLFQLLPNFQGRQEHCDCCLTSKRHDG